MKQFGLQLYSIRQTLETERDFEESIKKVAAMGYKEAHTAGCKIDPKRFIDILHENGMTVCGTHHNYDKIINNVQETIDLHRLWGTTNIGVGGMPNFDGKLETLKEFIKNYNNAAKIYAKEGFKLTYHNHAFEFARIDGYKTVMDILVEDLDPDNISFVLDTCWVQVGGGDVRHWMEKLAGRIDILHLKDCMRIVDPNNVWANALTMTEVGHGNLYMEGILETAEKIGVKSYIVEQDTCPGDPFVSMKQSADYLNKFIK